MSPDELARDSELPAPEQARIRHRDRKRETRMIVDNASVRRVAPALARKRAEREDASPQTKPRRG